jgi:hypothetical protein
VKPFSVNNFSKVYIIVIKKPFPSKAFARDAIFHCGDSIETAVDELKVPDCGNAKGETMKDAEFEKQGCRKVKLSNIQGDFV